MVVGIGLLASFLIYLSYLNNSPTFSLVILAIICLLYNYNKFKIQRQRAFNPIFFYVISAFIMGVSNIIGISSIDGPSEQNYFIYAIKENINEAILIACLGAIFVVIGYELNIRNYNYSFRTSLWKFTSSPSHKNSSNFFFMGHVL